MQSCVRSTMRALLLCSALLLSGTDTALAIDSTGLVVRILDGDTIEVRHNSHPERIRFKLSSALWHLGSFHCGGSAISKFPQPICKGI